jgi:hypothetical protein
MPAHVRLIIFEASIAGNFAAFLALMGSLYRAAHYHGQVDIGLAVTGIEGGYSSSSLRGGWGFVDAEGYAAPTYPRTARIAAAELDQPMTVANRLLQPLFKATTQREDFDVFA